MLTQDPACWVKGYQDGYYSRPYRAGADGLAYASGRIEGQADQASGKPCAHPLPADHNPTTDDRATERQKGPRPMTKTKPAPEVAIQRPLTPPDAVVTAMSILRGVEPPEIYWNLKPHHLALRTDSDFDLYLRPKAILQSPDLLCYLTTSASIEAENGIDSDPAYRARAIEQALLDCLNLLNRLTEDGHREVRSPLDRSEGRTRNHRLRVRLAAAVHDELAELLTAWQGLQG